MNKPGNCMWFVDAISTVDRQNDAVNFKHIKRFFGGNKILQFYSENVDVSGCDVILVHFYSADNNVDFIKEFAVGWTKK